MELGSFRRYKSAEAVLSLGCPVHTFKFFLLRVAVLEGCFLHTVFGAMLKNVWSEADYRYSVCQDARSAVIVHLSAPKCRSHKLDRI